MSSQTITVNFILMVPTIKVLLHGFELQICFPATFRSRVLSLVTTMRVEKDIDTDVTVLNFLGPISTCFLRNSQYHEWRNNFDLVSGDALKSSRHLESLPEWKLICYYYSIETCCLISHHFEIHTVTWREYKRINQTNLIM